MNPLHCGAWSVVAALALGGCDQIFQSRATRSFSRAEQHYKEGDFRAAAHHYEAALGGSSDPAELHYKLALLYDDKLADPVGALHHFQRYLDLEPKGSRAREAREFAKEDELKLVTKLSRGALITQGDAARLKNENLSLRKELTELRAEMKAAARAAPTPGKAVAEQKQKPIPAGAKTYTVQAGDTLASISRRHYKTSGRWKDIQEANFTKQEGTATLKPGMVLRIP